jgi:hypothetical protein
VLAFCGSTSSSNEERTLPQSPIAAAGTDQFPRDELSARNIWLMCAVSEHAMSLILALEHRYLRRATIRRNVSGAE